MLHYRSKHYNKITIYNQLENTLKLDNETDKYVLNFLIDDHLKNHFINEEKYEKRDKIYEEIKIANDKHLESLKSIYDELKPNKDDLSKMKKKLY